MPNEVPGTSQQAPSVSTRSTPELVADILDRRNESRRYMQINYWDAWEDVYRASKCRTKPIMVTDKSGNEVEDKTRTNVAMPELSLIVRRKTARLTANPPQINYTTSEDQADDASSSMPKLADRLTSWAYQQFDKSGEAQEHRKMVQSAMTFGWGVSKLYWDTVEITRQFFRQMTTPQDIAQYGNTRQMPTKVSQFEGPVSKNVFIGDFFMEPGAASLNVSGWVVENYFESDVFLEKMQAMTYLDPETGDERPVCDPKAIAELESMPSWQPVYQQQPFDLRSRLRTNALGQTLPLWPTKLLRGKRYDILECHTRDKRGKFWKEWVGNEKVYLGRAPYAWDLYGKYQYTEYVPLFDLLSAYGDSTPLLLRHLWLLHNAIVGSRRDLVANLLRPLMKAQPNLDIADEQIDRALFRIITMRDPNGLQPLVEDMGSIVAGIQGATEEEAQNMRMMALAEPNLTNVETGTEANPQAGKTATTAVLAAKASDALTQFEIDSLNWYLKESGEKKLAMLQQTEPEQDENGQYQRLQVAAKYAGMVEGWSQRYGKASVVNIDFMELQQEIQVEPAAMSMLSVDDDIRRTGTLQLLEMAGQMPGVIDPFYAARQFVMTIKGVDPDQAVKQPQPPQPQPPKVNVSVQVKWPELPAEARAEILQAAGAPVSPATMTEMQHEDTLKGIGKLSEAANHADNLMSQKSVDDEPDTNLTKGVGNSAPSSAGSSKANGKSAPSRSPATQ